MSRCIILGAGFSKAVAGLPTTLELFKKFKEEIEVQKKQEHSSYVNWGNEIIDFLEKLKKIPLGERTDLKLSYLDNFEAVCSWIDLNINTEVKVENKDEESIEDQAPFIHCSIGTLNEIRIDIATYLKLLLMKDKSNEELLIIFYNKFLSQNTSIISFNYDLILEKFLYRKDLWYPKDGYGIDLKVNNDIISPNKRNKNSSLIILKMHGSLNWEINQNDYSKVELERFDKINKNYSFPGYLENEPDDKTDYQRRDVAKSWLLPSWIKQFSFPELYRVWQLASKKLNEAEEIIFIGYSLPKEDSPVCTFFSAIDFSKKRIIVIVKENDDDKFEELKKRYNFLFPFNKINFINEYFENYLKNS